jgi:glycerol kinase
MGTGAFVSRLTGEKPLFQDRLLTSIVHEQDGVSHNVLEGTINGAGSALAWIRDDLEVKNMKDRLPGWLKEAENPPLFLNGISGLGAPYWDPDFESVFIGKGQLSEKVVAVVESIAFLIHTNLLQMEHSLPRPGRIQVTGGLSTLDGLCQLLADLTRIPVNRPVQTEATVRGTCYLLAGQPAHWPEEEPGVLFEPLSNQPIASRYAKWVEEMEKRVRVGG